MVFYETTYVHTSFVSGHSLVKVCWQSLCPLEALFSILASPLGLNYVFLKVLQLSYRHGDAVGLQLMDALGEKTFMIRCVCILKRAKQSNCYKSWETVLVCFTGSVETDCLAACLYEADSESVRSLWGRGEREGI